MKKQSLTIAIHRPGKWKKLVFQITAFLLCLLSSNILFSAECINSTAPVHILPPGVDQPSDLALSPGGDIYLVDGVNNRIVVVNGKGDLKFEFGKSGSKPGEFIHPMGIDISNRGRVFIADTGNHRIQVFSLKGDFLHLFPVKTAAGEKPAAPVDVLALDFKNYVYVSDRDNHKIKVHKQSGRFVFQWGRFGEGRGEFRYPGIMAKNAYNEIFVVDVLNTRVQKFDPFGNYVSEIGSWGVSPGELFKPKGVAVDKKDRVFVSDSYMGCIQVFTDAGGFLGLVCDNKIKRRFITPVGLAIDDQSRLHVVEMRANRISILNLIK
ncbi:MAG: hypothetical protein GXP53_03415 [Deltaproteobacteria bacterium]|nr:hypothetical protein [Deltaproteobacteria bacterium]